MINRDVFADNQPGASRANIQILAPFKPLLAREYEYYIYLSGRGAGKSLNIIRTLILLACQEEMRILCVREFQSSIAESVKAEIERQIEEMNLSHLFTSTREDIKCLNGSQFIFRGMQTSKAINIKSISNIKVCFIEEAEAISERSWDTLLPSVMRRKERDCIIVAALNPRYEEDVIYNRFVLHKPPPRSFVYKLLPEDNPFFAETQLKDQMEHDREILSLGMFKNKWLGEPITASEECLFTEVAFEEMLKAPPFYERSEYSTVVIGVDPALTNSKRSNQFGIVVVGTHRELQEYVVLGNYSNHHNPNSFAVEVARLYSEYDADCVVVEKNAGGMFIKATLVQVRPDMQIREVYASSGKVDRALPLANLASLGKIRLMERGRNELLRQMKNTTQLGYMGPAGESPDATDALAWCIHHLSDLSRLTTQQLVFSSRYFQTASMLDQFGFVEKEAWFFFSRGDETVKMHFEVRASGALQYCLKIDRCSVFSAAQLKEEIEAVEGQKHLNEGSAGFNIAAAGLSVYENINASPLDEKVKLILPALAKLNVVIDKCSGEWKRHAKHGNVLEQELYNYTFNEKNESIVVDAFCHFIHLCE